MKTLRPHLPSPALVIACLALFAALGGTTYAATSGSASSQIRWTNAKLLGGWKPGGGISGEATPGYAEDSLGIVHLRGAIWQGSTNCSSHSSVMFVLPKALRPRHNLDTNAVILSTGKVESDCPAHLDGLSFVAGQ